MCNEAVQQSGNGELHVLATEAQRTIREAICQAEIGFMVSSDDSTNDAANNKRRKRPPIRRCSFHCRCWTVAVVSLRLIPSLPKARIRFDSRSYGGDPAEVWHLLRFTASTVNHWMSCRHRPFAGKRELNVSRQVEAVVQAGEGVCLSTGDLRRN